MNKLPQKQKKFKGISLYVPQELQKALRQLALDEETTVTALGEEAIVDLLKKRSDEKTSNERKTK